MYAKLINNTIRPAPKKLCHNGNTIFNPSPDILAEHGYLPVTYADMPTDAPSGQHYESGWEEGDKIVQTWTLTDDPVYPEPELSAEERISNLETTTDELKSTSDDIILMMADLIGGQE